MTAPTGLIDLEKELTCSICTEVLYQPLTLLDCLHTFCGSCLKEWFGWQKQNADKDRERDDRHHHNRHDRTSRQRRRKPYVFTCPSCRAVVRETRPNATVTTLLDMYLAANPDKAKSAAEKAEIAKQYTHGEHILPKPEDSGAADAAGDEAEDETEDRRLVDQVREMSLREIAGGGTESTQNNAQRGGPATHTDSPRRRTQQDATPRSRATQLGHQSSLRSLLSPHDSEELKEEILRQIAEEGLLDDIDWDNMEVEQEDEISERIAQAYRRRRRDRSQQGPAQQREEPSSRREASREPRRSGEQQRQQPQPPRRSNETPASYQARATGSRPPTSYQRSSETVDSRPRPWHHHRRSSSHGRGLQPPEVSEVGRHAARSATDLSERPSSSHQRSERQRRASHGQRSSTDPEGLSVSEQWRRAATRPNHAPHQQPETTIISTENTGRLLPAAQTVQSPTSSISVSCDRCGRASIETKLHYCCTLCRPQPATYDLCLQCYRQGKGCLHWFGFGYSAWPRYERLGSPGPGPPHVLKSRKYLAGPDVGIPPGELVLQEGVFCDICHANANACYWHCDACNDGEWGFCHACVNRAKHCTHPLLPLALQSAPPDSTPQLHPLLLPTTCNNCHEAIPAAAQRLHCPECDAGDYDMCTACHAALVAAGRVSSRERRCPAGHRMLVVAFVERDPGRWWREVVDGPTGGWALDGDGDTAGSDAQWSWRESDDGRRAYKDVRRRGGGDAKRLALWSWVPDEGAANELAFPKGAVIAEVEDINGDFLWGVYCRAGGLFPAGYVRPVE